MMEGEAQPLVCKEVSMSDPGRPSRSFVRPSGTEDVVCD
jgi:hypothetical protein